MKKTQNVTIKGTKDGLTLHLDDSCSYEDLKRELDEKLNISSQAHDDRQLISVQVQMGNRYLTDEQEEELKHLIRQKKNLIVEAIHSNVMTKAETEKLLAEFAIKPILGVIRSGQVLQVEGDLLLIGDVNPGGTVIAGGNIYIMGALKGIAHAGYNGNQEAIISASLMKPSQLRISQYINRAPDRYPDEEQYDMKCAYLDDQQQIIIDRLQVLTHLRPNLTRLEGGR